MSLNDIELGYHHQAEITPFWEDAQKQQTQFEEVLRVPPKQPGFLHSISASQNPTFKVSKQLSVFFAPKEPLSPAKPQHPTLLDTSHL